MTTRRENLVTALFCVVPIAFWVQYAFWYHTTRGTAARASGLVILGVTFAVLIYVAVLVVGLRSTSNMRAVWRALSLGFFTLNLYIYGFASVYLSYGGGATNFLVGPDVRHKLGRLDAAYFTMTTFTTTGFGDWRPISESARAVVLAQMASGFVLVSVLLALVVSSVVALIGVRGDA